MNFENPSQLFKADEPNAAANPNVIAVTKKDSEEQTVPDVLSILPVRGMVIFPGTVVPLSIRFQIGIPTFAACTAAAVSDVVLSFASFE